MCTAFNCLRGLTVGLLLSQRGPLGQLRQLTVPQKEAVSAASGSGSNNNSGGSVGDVLDGIFDLSQVSSGSGHSVFAPMDRDVLMVCGSTEFTLGQSVVPM